ncbi:hypothetical protein [Polymorphospora rubra]|uniref:Transmembrane protein n=1 Tax=Polymorphospora rubra TaxID=338584 RepID=A0A810N8P0_9ACTN|nr:hypothetical protein [Polymorphospora rubra]BCJ67973.1 hypothetical protein Prubr_49940 [Polymorphospora rubra]
MESIFRLEVDVNDKDTAADAADKLAETQKRLHLGATAARLRLPLWYLVLTCALATAFGAGNDIPLSTWNAGWFLRQLVMFGSLATWIVFSRIAWRRGRPLPAGFGPRIAVVAFASVAVLYVLATLLGLWLQASAIPLPFTLAGMAFGLVAVVAAHLTTGRVAAIYQKRVAEGRW